MRSFLVLSAAVILGIAAASPAVAEYPRRIAIAPFTILGPREEIRQTVDLLPRLMASRLMAMAGAQVLILPPGEASPADSAKQGGLPLVLTGSVAKLGAGYSIDVAVTEADSGRIAGAFFAAAATEDEIIPRLGELAADISEKVFGIKAAIARAQPPVAQPATTPPPVPVPAAPSSPIPSPAPSPAQGITPPAARAAPAPAAAPEAAAEPSEGRVPSAIRKIAESGKIPDELHGVVSGNADSEGACEIVAYGKKGIHLYRAKGEDLLAVARITEGLPDHVLNVEASDIDGDGAKEILVTGMEGGNIRSMVLKRSGETYRKVADRLPYFLVLLPDWKGKEVVAGQQHGDDIPFHGRFYAMVWDGNTFRMGEALPADTMRAPLFAGILGLSSARFGQEWKWVYTDENDRLRVVDPDGNAGYKTEAKYGWSGDSFEWGLHLPRAGKTKYYVRKAVRILGGTEGKPVLLTPAAEEALLNLESSSKTTRLALLRWDGGEFVELAGTPKGDRIHSGADFLSCPGPLRGRRAVASVIEQPDSVLKGGVSRLVLFEIE